MLDPATRCIEIKEIKSKHADIVADVLEKTWLTCYPRPSEITLDLGSELMAEVMKIIKNDYGIKKLPITVRNPQTNSFGEPVNKTIANILSTFIIHDTAVDEEDP